MVAHGVSAAVSQETICQLSENMPRRPMRMLACRGVKVKVKHALSVSSSEENSEFDSGFDSVVHLELDSSSCFPTETFVSPNKKRKLLLFNNWPGLCDSNVPFHLVNCVYF